MTNHSQLTAAALLRFSDAKAAALALCSPNAKLQAVERDGADRLVWEVSGLPIDYVTRFANDELPSVSPRAAVVALEMTLWMVAEPSARSARRPAVNQQAAGSRAARPVLYFRGQDLIE
jgi:hypothetical protein